MRPDGMKGPECTHTEGPRGVEKREWWDGPYLTICWTCRDCGALVGRVLGKKSTDD